MSSIVALLSVLTGFDRSDHGKPIGAIGKERA
jgi:hypothetical protein